MSAGGGAWLLVLTIPLTAEVLLLIYANSKVLLKKNNDTTFFFKDGGTLTFTMIRARIGTSGI